MTKHANLGKLKQSKWENEMDICKLNKTHMNNLQIVLIDIVRVQRSKNLLGVREVQE